jgi:hypothetical protein
MFERIKKYAARTILAVSALIAAVPTGCTADQRQDAATKYADARVKLDAVRAPTTQMIADFEAEAAKLPVGDPARVFIEKNAAATRLRLKQIDDTLAKVDAGVSALQTGDVSGLTALLGGLPGVGRYASLAVLLGMYLKRTMDAANAQRATEQVIRSVEAAIPEKSEEQKKAMAAVQDANTKALVERIKTN